MGTVGGMTNREQARGLGIHPTGVRAAEDVEQKGSPLYPEHPDPVIPNDENYTPQQPQVSTPPDDIPSNALPPTQEDTYGPDGQTEDVSYNDGTEGMIGAPEPDEDDEAPAKDAKTTKASKGK
jgi:hypothetical protein